MPQVVFSDWSGGEFGDLGPTGCKDNQFTGLNVMVYKDGSVGPRPGFKGTYVLTTGDVWAFRGVGSNDGNARIFYGQGKNIKRWLPADLTTAVVGTISITATVTTQIIQMGPAHAEIPIYGHKVYEAVDFSLPGTSGGSYSVKEIPSSPGGKVGTVYGVRLLVGNTTTNPKRVYYTGAQTTTAIATSTWPALNFFDVGLPDWDITFMDEQRQRVSIGNNGGEWWGLTGTPGVNDSLRRQPRGDQSPAQWYHATRVGESVWFLPQGKDFPVQFTGSVVDKLRWKYLRFTGGVGTDFVAGSLPAADIVLFAQVVQDGSAPYLLMLCNDVWTYHQTTANIQYITPPSVGGTGVNFDSPIFTASRGGDGSFPGVFAFQPTLDRPGKTGDTYAAPGDSSSTTPLTATFATRYFWASDRDIRVTAVTIDGFTWNTGSASTNHVDVQVRSLFRYDAVPYVDSVAQSFDEPTAITTTDRTDKRFRITNPDAPWAQGFQIRLSAIRGFAVRRIRVEYDEGPHR